MDTCHQFSLNWKKFLLVSPQNHHSNCHFHRHNYNNHQRCNCRIERNKNNNLLPISDTIAHKALFQLNSIFSNASSVLKPRQSSIFKLPRVSTPKSFAAPPRVSPSTQKIHNISPTTQKHCRDLRSAKSKTSPKNHIFNHHPTLSPTLYLAPPLLLTLMLPLQS